LATNEEFDKAVRHQIEVRRFSAGEVLLMLAILKDVDKRVIRTLRQRLPGMRVGTKRFRQMMNRVKKIRAKGMGAIDEKLRSDLKRFARLEAAFEKNLLNAVATKSQSLSTPRDEQGERGVLGTGRGLSKVDLHPRQQDISHMPSSRWTSGESR
jgi:hypothetical protein